MADQTHSISEWHRYVDRMSRPARRLAPESECESEPWRPWKEHLQEQEPAGEADRGEASPLRAAAIRPGSVPDLASILANRPLGIDVTELLAGPAAEEIDGPAVFRDLTVDDELPPLEQHSVPEFSAPSFEVELPRLVPLAAQPALPLDLEPAAPLPPDPGIELQGAANRRDLLARLNGDADPGAAETRGRRESRQELLYRLVDPVLTLDEAAVILEVCPTTVRRYTNKGHLKHFRTKGNQRRFRFSDVVEFLESRAAEIQADSLADREAGRTDAGSS